MAPVTSAGAHETRRGTRDEIMPPPCSPEIIRPPPVDDVNNLRHDCRCQRCAVPMTYSHHRNALFTSPEYAVASNLVELIANGARNCLPS
jgi:hypothetical protein